MASISERAAGAARQVRAMPTRRKVLLGGASVAALGGLGVLSLFAGEKDAELAGLRRSQAVALGDGFYRVNGWVLTEADLADLPD